MHCFLLLVGTTCLLSLHANGLASGGPYTLTSKNITVTLGDDGKVTGIQFGRNGVYKAVTAYTEIAGFRSRKDIATEAPDKRSIRFEHNLYSDSLKQSCRLVETFTTMSNSIRWKLEITGQGAPWSSVIRTVINYPAGSESRFWTSWGEPQFDSSRIDLSLLASLSPFKTQTGAKGWLDPLVPVPFSTHTLYYGAPPFEYENPKVGFIPAQGNLFAIPFASVFEKKQDAGFSVFLSPEDNIINLLMQTQTDGAMQFDRLYNKVSAGKKIIFSLDLAGHQSDWRSALNWFATRYPAYVNPKNPAASALGGTAAYSNFFDNFDAEKMKKMAFTVNWQASFDFPYMGMFLPPVKRDEIWTRLGGGSISIAQMDVYAKRIRQQGFYVMNYFNVTEFGTDIKYPAPPPVMANSRDSWKDCNTYLREEFPGAMLTVSPQVKITKAMDSKTVTNGPYFTWKYAVAMDCGDSAYQRFLLNQAQRHVDEIPNSYGICIDRLDWLRFFNENADDQITWFNDKPARSLVSSWKDLMTKLGPIMHRAGKSILVNNHYKRIDLLNETDGILDEFTNATVPLNTTAFLTLNKPALGWTPGKESIEADGGDHFFQKYLYLGVFPMCPFPGNDHALLPDPVVDQLYLDYGPLMNQLKEKSWVLRAGVISVNNETAKANIFKTAGGYSIPVVYGDGNTATIKLNEPAITTGVFKFRCYLPGQAEAVEIKPRRNGDGIELKVPLVRRAAMITITK